MPKSPFQTGERKAVPACLIYAKADGHVLMLHRNAGKDGGRDIHEGKWNGLGGKLEAGESPAEGARREFREESGKDLPEDSFRPLGVLHFPNFKADASEDWIVWVFEAAWPEPASSGLVASTREGDLHWVPKNKVTSLPLWEGDKEFLAFVLEGKPFIGAYWYEAGALTRSWIRGLVYSPIDGQAKS